MDYAKIIDELKSLRPSKIVLSRGGQDSEVRLRTGRGRWESAAKILGAIDDGSVTLYDDEDRVVGVLSLGGAGANRRAQELGPNELMALLIKAQDMALSRYEPFVKTILEAQGGVISTVSRRLSSLERTYGEVLQQQYDAVTSLAESDSARAEEVSSVDSALDKLASVVLEQGMRTKGVQ